MPSLGLSKSAILKVVQPGAHALKILSLASFALTIISCSSVYIPSQKAIEEKLNIFETQEVTCPATRILRDGDTYLLASEQSSGAGPKPIATITRGTNPSLRLLSPLLLLVMGQNVIAALLKAEKRLVFSYLINAEQYLSSQGKPWACIHLFYHQC